MAVLRSERALKFLRRRDGVAYAPAEQAASRAELEPLQALYPGSYIQWETAGILIAGPDGAPRMSKPMWVLWRPLSEPAPEAAGPPEREPDPPPGDLPEPGLAAPAAADDLPELEDPATFLGLAPAAAPAPPVKASRRGGQRRPRATKSVKHKNLTRVDRDRPGRAPEHGFHVRLSWKGQVFQKWFSDTTHGDRLGALTAALAWRDEKERALGKPRTEHVIKGQDSTSNTGIVGVARLDVDGHPYYRALWRDPEGRQHVRFFRIDLLGEQRALRAAIKARAEGIAWQLR
jgi:hypothetical protein